MNSCTLPAVLQQQWLKQVATIMLAIWSPIRSGTRTYLKMNRPPANIGALICAPKAPQEFDFPLLDWYEKGVESELNLGY